MQTVFKYLFTILFVHLPFEALDLFIWASFPSWNMYFRRSFNADLLKGKCLNLHLSVNPFILLYSSWKIGLPSTQFWVTFFFFFLLTLVLWHFLLVSTVAVDKSAISLIVFFYFRCSFSLAALKILFFPAL